LIANGRKPLFSPNGLATAKAYISIQASRLEGRSRALFVIFRSEIRVLVAMQISMVP